MPWQADFADVLGEYDPDTGIPFYDQAFYTVPRQSGKTLLLLAWAFRKCLSEPYRRLAWSAQSGKDARDKWIDELFPMVEASSARALIAPNGLSRGMGNEAIRFRNKSLIRLVSNSTKAGHGKTLHGDCRDEIFADVDSWRDQAFTPGQLTIPDSQTLLTSTAGTAASVIYNNLRREGRNAVKENRDYGLCYVEYSADPDWDYLDTSTYRAHMPAVGHTVTETKVLSAIKAMLLDPKQGHDGVLRAYGNISAGAGDSPIPEPVWERVVNRTATPAGRLSFGVAVAQDRSSSAIAAADEHGNVELVEHRGGTGWVIERMNQITANNPGSGVVLDSGGPAGSLADNIDHCDPWNGSKVIDAHAAFTDAVVEATGIAVRQDTALDKAVSGVVKKNVGDRFVWSRVASTEDVTPLEAATLAWAAARQNEPKYEGPMVAVR